MTPPRRLRVSIGLQLVALILACIAATHLVVFAAVSLLPPPRPPLYRISEIAAALQGGPLETRLGRPLLRETSDKPPTVVQTSRRQALLAETLAAELNLPRDRLRFVPRPPGPLERMFQPDRAERRRVLGMRNPDRREGRPAPRNGFGPGQRELVMGDFTAALQRGDGRWTIVRTAPEPFPTEWQRRMLLILGAGFAVVAPAGLLFARRITAPLKRFGEAAERLGRDPLGPQLTLSGPAEIGAAAEAFNNMQGRLRRYIDDRTAMVGAISHDLRTPLARIRFKLERAPEEVRARVLADVGQMEQMIQGVLTFIRDEGTPRRRERLDLLSLVECVVDDASMLGWDVELEDAEPVTVEGDPVALQRLFVNLVENAVKYGRLARVSVSQLGGDAVVEVRDAGGGLGPTELEKVFQPFYRADASRNLDAGGIGLGLPIARSTARAHGGDVVLAPRVGGLVARVTLPLA
jgi:signal transduction histidine kinase